MFFFFFDNHALLFDKAWAPLERSLAESRKRYPQLTVGALETLIHIARNQREIADGRLTLPKIAQELGVPYSTLARHTDVLGAGVNGRKGLGLIEKKGGQGKVHAIELTMAGMLFVAELHNAQKKSKNIKARNESEFAGK